MRSSRYHDGYLAAIDNMPDNIYCHHDYMGETGSGENHVPRHVHSKGQFLYSEGGIVHVATDEKNYFLPARHYIWIPAGVMHSVKANVESVMMRNLFFPVREDDKEFYSTTAIYPVNDLLLEMLFFTGRWSGQVNPSDEMAYSFMLALKHILPEISSFSLPLSLPYPRSKRLLEIAAYLYAHMDENIAFPELARHFGYSERTLARVFTQELNMSFVQFFTLQRMLRALELLLEERHTVNETAFKVGYNSVPTFSNTFYKILGTRPSDYVKLQGVLKHKR